MLRNALIVSLTCSLATPTALPSAVANNALLDDSNDGAALQKAKAAAEAAQSAETKGTDSAKGDAAPVPPAADVKVDAKAVDSNVTDPKPVAPKVTDSSAGKTIDKTARNIRFQFDGIQLSEVIRRFAQMANKPIIGELKIEGTLTFFDSEPYTYDEAMDTLNLILAMRGSMLLPEQDGRFLRLVSVSDLPTNAGVKILSGLDEAEGLKVRPGEVITVVLPVHHMDVETASKAIVPMVNVFGRIAPLARGKGILLTDTYRNIKRVRDVLAMLDLKADEEAKLDMKSYQLKRAAASNAANIINNLLRVSGKRSEGGESRTSSSTSSSSRGSESIILASADDRSNLLILRGTKDMLEMADQLVLMVDSENPDAGDPVQSFALKTAAARDVAEAIRTIVGSSSSSSRSGSGGKPIYVYGDSSMNSVLVRAGIEDMAMIAKLIESLDKSVKDLNGVRAFPLKNTQAASIVEVLRAVLTPRDTRGERTVGNIAVTADVNANVIYVSGTPSVLENAAKIIADVDKPSEDEVKEIHVVTLKDADATQVAATLSTMYAQQFGKNASPALLPTIMPIVASNSVIVSAAPKQWAAVKKLMEEIQAASVPTNTPVTSIITLKHAKALELATTLQTIYVHGATAARVKIKASSLAVMPAASTDTPIIITPSERNNSIIISAAESDQASIADMIARLDIEATEKVDPIQIVTLKSADAASVAQTLNEMLAKDPAMKASPIAVTADVATNTVLVRAAESQRKMVETLIASLDEKTLTNAREQRTIAVQHVSASGMVQMLMQLHAQPVKGAGSDINERVIIAAAPGDRMLIVDAPKQKIAQIAQIIATMNKADGSATQQIRTYPLTKSNAKELAGVLTRMFPADPKAVPGADLPPRFDADTNANQLIASATAAQFEQIEKVIKEVMERLDDVTMTRTYRLKHAKAGDVVPVIESMLVDAPVGNGATAVARGKEPASVRVAALAATNDIIIQGSPEKHALAAELIKTFDDPEASKTATIQVVQLRNAQATSMAAAVSSIFEAKRTAVKVDAGAQEESFSVTAEPNSNSVLIRGSAEQVAEAIKLINRLDSESKPGSTQMKIYRLNNGDAAALSKTVEALFRSIIAQQNDKLKGIEPPPFSAAADERTNSLVVSTTASYFTLVEELLAQLDESQPERQTEYFTLVNADADVIATQLADLFADRKTDKPVISPDYFTSSVTVIAKEADMKLISAHITKVDKAQVEDTSRQFVVVPMKQQSAKKMAEMLKTVYQQTSPSKVIITEKIPEGIKVEPAPMPMPEPAPQPKKEDSKPGARLDAPMNMNDLALDVSGDMMVDLEATLLSTALASAEFIAAAADPTVKTVELPEPKAGEPVPDVVIAVDEATNSLIISGTRKQIAEMQLLITQFSDPSATDGDMDFRVFTVKHSDPEVLTQILNSLFNPKFLQQQQQLQGGNAQQQQLFQMMQQQLMQQMGGQFPGGNSAGGEDDGGRAGRGTRGGNTAGNAAGGNTGGNAQTTQRGNQRTQQQQQQVPPTVILVADRRTNRIIARGKPADLDLVETVIKQIDTTTTLASEVRVFVLKNTDAREVASNLNEMFVAKRTGASSTARGILIQSKLEKEIQDATGSKEPVDMASVLSIGSNAQTNSIVVAAPGAAMGIIAEIIQEIDQSAATTSVPAVRMYPVKHADLNSTVSNLRSVFAPLLTGAGAAGAGRVVITADAGANTIIVSASPDQHTMIAQVIGEIEKSQPGDELLIKVYRINNAEASSVSNTLNTMLSSDGSGSGALNANSAAMRLLRNPRGGGTTVANTPGASVAASTALRITADTSSNSLVIRATKEQHEQIGKLIEEIDIAVASAQPVQLVSLKNADAISVAGVLNKVFANQQQNIGGRNFSGLNNQRQPIVIEGDRDSKMLMIRADEQSFTKIKEMAMQLDVASPAGMLTQRIIQLKHARAQAIAAALTDSFANTVSAPAAGGANRLTGGAPADPVQRVIIVAEPDSNAIIVTASEDNHAKVALLVASLDNESRSGQGNDFYVVKNGEAVSMASMLQKIATGSVVGGGRGAQQRGSEVTIAGDASTGVISFAGPASEVTRMKKLANDIDVAKGADETGIAIVPITNGDAVQIAATVNELFQKVTLSQIGKSGASSEKFAVSADARSNSVIIVGSPAMQTQLRFTIGHLELVTPQRGQLRVVNLQHADPSEFQRVIYSIYGGTPDAVNSQQNNANTGNNQGNAGNRGGNQGGNQGVQPGGNQGFQPGGGQRGGGNQGGGPRGGAPAGGPRSDMRGSSSTGATTESGRVTATPLPQQKSVLINSNDADYEAIVKLAAAMDEAAKASKRQAKVIIVKNADNIRLATMLNQMYLQSVTNLQNQDERVAVTALAGTQALVVTASPTKMPEVEALVAQLDNKEVTPQVEFRIYQVKNTSPTKILPLMKQLLDKATSVRQDGGADVQADERTKSLIVTAKASMFDEIGKIVNLLDTAPANETAEVMIVQLKRSDATRMATVLNSMLRPADATIVTPEARALQEHVRVLKVMDATGKKAIELDLTKPIKVTADPLQAGEQGSNALLVSSTPDNLKGLVALIEMMDRVPLTDALKVELVHLKVADAEAVARTLSEIFTQGSLKLAGKQGTPVAGKAEPAEGEGKALVNPLNVSFDARTNMLVLSGREETLALALQITKDLDRESSKFVTEVKLFPLKHARASTLAPMLSEVFAEQAQGGGGANATGIEGVKTQVTRLRKVLDDGKTVDSETAKSRAALTIRPDDSTQTLVVAARSDVMPLISDVIKSLDIPGAGAANLVRFMPLENADATRLKTVIDSLYTGQNAKDVREIDIPTVAVDTRTNALIISASDKTFIVIDAMTRQLDKKNPIELKEIKLIKLKNAEATAIAPVLQQAMDERVARQTSLGVADAESLKMMVVADARSNSLLVGGSPEGFKLVESIALQIDEAGPALSGQIQIFALKEANAGNLSTTLTQLFTQRYAAAATPDVQRQKPIILPDLRSNSLVVAANADDTKVLTGLLTKMDVKITDPAVGLFVVGMKHNDAGIVGPSIQRLMQARLTASTVQGQAAAPQDQVSIETDALSNALIISASKENLALIESLLTKVDIEPPPQTGVVRMYVLTNSDATRVSEMLKSLATQGFVKPGAPTTTGANQVAAARDKISIEVDSRTNVLIVSASKENFAVIDEIIKQIDSGKDFGLLGDVRMYVVKFADATRLAPTLQDFFDKKKTAESSASPDGAAARALTVSIIPDARTNTLLVAGSKESFAAVEAMLKQLDVQGGTNASEFRVFELKQATANAIQPMLKSLFDARYVRGTTKDAVTILADSRSNALVVGASAEDMLIAEGLIKQLDIKPKDLTTTVRMFPLQKGDALQVATTLRGLYANDAGTGTTGGNAGGNATTGVTGGVSISVDERLNAIIVSAGVADLERIAGLIKQLDTHTTTRVTEIRPFVLQHADATELAALLNEVLTKAPTDPTKTAGVGGAATARQTVLQFLDTSSTGKEVVAQAVQEGVMISADKRSNMLVVSAPLDYMPLLTRLIKSLDQTTPKKAEIQMFKLVNADATRTADILTQLFKLEAAEGSNPKAVEYTLVNRSLVSAGGVGSTDASAPFGTAEQDSLRVTVDTRTNSLFVGGGTRHVALASQVIAELDESPALERKTEIIRLRNGQALDIETAISGFLDQERQRMTATLGTDKIGSAQRLAEQDVSIIAEPSSNTILISASPRYFDQVKAMVSKLDDPKPQVLIQVLLAEVTLDDGTDLGFEWQYQGKIGENTVTAGTDFGIQQAFNQFGGLGVAVTGGDLTFFLRALQSQGKLEVLSRPQILASDNQPANINVGQRVPFVTNSQVSDTGNVVNTIQYQDVGILLNVVARISDDGFVNMDVRPEISSLSTSSVQVSEAVSAPIINSRSAETKVTVQDGHTIVIGGLITSSDEHRESKVPILGDIPILGEAFKNTSKKKNRTELLIILTPRVLYKPGDAEEITKFERERLEMMKKLKLEDAGKAVDIPFNGNGPLRDNTAPAAPAKPSGEVKKPTAPADFGVSDPTGKRQTSASPRYDAALTATR